MAKNEIVIVLVIIQLISLRFVSSQQQSISSKKSFQIWFTYAKELAQQLVKAGFGVTTSS